MHILKVIADELNKIDVPYAFMRWTSAVQYPYFIGEYTEEPTVTEDGLKECTLILTGTTKGDDHPYMELEEIRAKIEDHFPADYGLRVPTDQGVVVIFYANSFPVPTGEMDLKRIQINLQVKSWKGMK